MKVLAAENNISYTANNACKIYIIKQVDLEREQAFIDIYANLIKDGTNANSLLNFNHFIEGEKKIQLTKLISYNNEENEELYTKINIQKNAEIPDTPFYENKEGEIKYYSHFWFLKSLFELRNCPLLDFSKAAYVFQIEGQSKGGLANVVSFNTNFNVNGQSSAELILNNKDYLYNFKNFCDKEKYNIHLKSYFDTNDIIIIRHQKRNTQQDSLLNSFKSTNNINYWKDPYIDSEIDPFTTIFTGYINDINEAFSFNNGQQTLTISCTGPSKKLTWTRSISGQAAASKDSYSSLLPLSAFSNPQTMNENNKTDISNEDVIKNLIVRTYSGVLNIPDVKKAYKEFTDAFDIANTVKTDLETTNLRNEIDNLRLQQENNTITVSQQKKLQNLQQQLKQNESVLRNKVQDQRKIYNDLIKQNFNKFAIKDEKSNEIRIIRHTFISKDKFGNCPTLFVIKGTDQPAYQWTFQNFSSLFFSDYSTVYQFIKSIADDLQFNFYDDPYGVIHFEVPDMTIMHLHKPEDPNNLDQIISFSETQNTENIANIQIAKAKFTHNVPLEMINTVIKDYRSIDKYGEKMMQPLEITGITNIEALKYAGKMKMAKYNRKALSNIRVNMNGQANLQLGKYAYIKSLRKLFYIESYSHSYNAGGDFSTSLNGTYTRDILFTAKLQESDKAKSNDDRLKNAYNIFLMKSATSELHPAFNKRLAQAKDNNAIIEILNDLSFPKQDELNQKIYQTYVDNWKYPENNPDLKLELAALYTEDSLRLCYLDDFIWAIPFDVNPYKIAKQIQDEELRKKNQLAKTKKVKNASRVKVATTTNKTPIKSNKHTTLKDVKLEIGPTSWDILKNIGKNFTLNIGLTKRKEKQQYMTPWKGTSEE